MSRSWLGPVSCQASRSIKSEETTVSGRCQSEAGCRWIPRQVVVVEVRGRHTSAAACTGMRPSPQSRRRAFRRFLITAAPKLPASGSAVMIGLRSIGSPSKLLEHDPADSDRQVVEFRGGRRDEPVRAWMQGTGRQPGIAEYRRV